MKVLGYFGPVIMLKELITQANTKKGTEQFQGTRMFYLLLIKLNQIKSPCCKFNGEAGPGRAAVKTLLQGSVHCFEHGGKTTTPCSDQHL